MTLLVLQSTSVSLIHHRDAENKYTASPESGALLVGFFMQLEEHSQAFSGRALGRQVKIAEASSQDGSSMGSRAGLLHHLVH